MTLHTIVIATADEDLRETAHIVLEQPLVYVFDAADGAAALGLAREARPSVLIIDGGLPGLVLEEYLPALDEALRQEAAEDEQEEIPTRLVVLLEAGQDVEVARRFADAVLTREFDPEELARLVAALSREAPEAA